MFSHSQANQIFLNQKRCHPSQHQGNSYSYSTCDKTGIFNTGFIFFYLVLLLLSCCTNFKTCLADSRTQKELKNEKYQDTHALRYNGKWFSLLSTMKEEFVVIAIDQLNERFDAFEKILPPVTQPGRTIEILLLDNKDAYEQRLKVMNIVVQNRGIFAPKVNQIVTYSDLALLQKKLDQVRAENLAEGKRIALLEEKNREKLLEDRRKIGAGAPRQVILEEARKRAARIAQEKRESTQRIKTRNREMEELKKREVNSTLQTLYHEAFHAYLHNFIYPKSQQENQVPRWIEEGLAQIFEANTQVTRLKVDYDRLKQLKANLESKSPFELFTVLTAKQKDFLHIEDSNQKEKEKLLYLYSWGVAYYILTPSAKIEFSTKALDQYREKVKQGKDLEGFEAFTGMPFAEFEKKWKKAILRIPIPKSKR